MTKGLMIALFVAASSMSGATASAQAQYRPCTNAPKNYVPCPTAPQKPQPSKHPAA